MHSYSERDPTSPDAVPRERFRGSGQEIVPVLFVGEASMVLH
jgi:hypothetical protein